VTAAALLAALAALAAPAAPGAREAPRAALARVERTEVRLGEPFGYEIEVRHPPAERVVMAPGLDAPPFRGEGGACRRDAEAGGEVRTVCSLRLSLFALGAHDVPEVALAMTADGREETLLVPGPRVTGVGVIDPAAPGPLALRDPAPPVPLLVPTLRLLGWAALAAAAAAAALLARRAWRKRRRAPEAAAPPPEPPGAALARRLDALEAEGLATPEAVAALSAAVRAWVGAVAGVPALDLTTAELVVRLERGGVPGLDVAALGRLCAEADLVKFARAPADAARWGEWLRWARALAAWAPATTVSTSAATGTATSGAEGARPAPRAGGERGGGEGPPP
jgi:hypothetical protein